MKIDPQRYRPERGFELRHRRARRTEVQNHRRREALELLASSRIAILLSTVSALLEGLAEAFILTILARSALATVTSERALVYVPVLGEQPFGLAMGILGLAIAARTALGLSNNWLSNRIQYRIVKEIRQRVVASYTAASWASQSRFEEGALQQLVVTLPNSISNHLAGLITNIGHFLIMVAMIGYAAGTDPLLTLVLIVTILFASFLFRPLRSWIKGRSSQALVEQQNLSSLAAEVSAMKYEANAFGVETRLAGPLGQAVEREASFQEAVGRIRGMIVPLYTLISYSAMLGSLLILHAASPENLAKTGPLLLVVLRSLSYGTALQNASASIASLTPSLDLLRRQFNVLSEDAIAWGRTRLKKIEKIEFDRVSFSYKSDEPPALTEASFEIREGTRLGLAGPSGSGKSTLVKLLLGLVEPTSGSVIVNGRELTSYSRAAWTSVIGVVPQSPVMLRGSIGDNVKFLRDGISDNDVWEALEIADLDGEVSRMPDGIRTELGPGKRVLSGGQQQRLAIARAFAIRPSLVVLDEPTSSIDALSEEQISEALSRLPENVTMIVISHRKRIFRECHRVLLFENSQIVGSKTPNEMSS